MTPAEEQIAFYRELGLALAHWAELERTLYVTMSIFFPFDKRPILGMGFFGIDSFRSKLKFCDNAITRGLAGAKLTEDWQALAGRLQTQSQIRNKLAHNQTHEYPKNTEGRRWALSPPYGPKQAPKDQPIPGSFCLRDIIKARYEFEALRVSLLNFCSRLVKHPEPFPKSDEQANDPPTIQQIARQIHEELGHPQQSSRERQRMEDAENAAASWRSPTPGEEGNDTQAK